MGIPVYFKTCINNYNLICLEKINKTNYLFFDLNCLIHPCCKDLTNEKIMIENIIYKLNNLIQMVNPSKLIYIAIDGPCPKPKIIQQRIRRFKSANENKIWDTNAITPGTKFMENLEIKISEYIKTLKTKVIFSGCLEKGEGEHKIFQYINQHKLNTNIVVYGLDADLIMLSMIVNCDSIYLLRETTEYNLENVNSDYIYLDINKLKVQIKQSVKNIFDYIFICFLLGNDFIQNTPSINLRYNGLEYLTNIYSSFDNDFYLIDINFDLHFKNFKKFIEKLKINENKRLKYILNIREKQELKFKNSKNTSLHDPIIKRNKEKYIFSDLSNWRSKYYLQILFNQTEQVQNLDKKIEKMCINYIQTLLWTKDYYFKECKAWRFSYNYNYAPSLFDIYNILDKFTDFDYTKDNLPYSSKEQLKMVLPLKSHNLLYKNTIIDILMYPTNPQKSHILKRYEWESILILPKL